MNTRFTQRLAVVSAAALLMLSGSVALAQHGPHGGEAGLLATGAGENVERQLHGTAFRIFRSPGQQSVNFDDRHTRRFDACIVAIARFRIAAHHDGEPHSQPDSVSLVAVRGLSAG